MNGHNSVFSIGNGIFSVLAVLVFFFSTGVVQAQSEESPVSNSTGTITGHVTNENGQPLPYAQIVLRGTQPQFQVRLTNADSEGNFQITGLDPLLYGISASFPSYVTPPRDPETAPVYYRIGDRANLTLVKGGVISGTVSTANGEPAVQIAVRATMVRDASGQRPRFGGFQLTRSADDRGVFRIYGLQPGTYVVLAGGRTTLIATPNAFDGDAPTYAPSSTRDTAAEITVRAGEESSGVDIRYRGEPGHTVSGLATAPIDSSSPTPITVSMVQIWNGTRMGSVFAFQSINSKGFAFFGVADGEYEILAQSTPVSGETYVSESLRIFVKGADVTGLELVAKPLGSIVGRVTLKRSQAPECANKRQPVFAETLVIARRNSPAQKDTLEPPSFFLAQGSPNFRGDFRLRNLSAGQYALSSRFYAKYWYLRSITQDTPSPAADKFKTPTPSKQIDIARTGVNLKSGEALRDMTIALAEGAGSLRGKIMRDVEGTVPPKLQVHLFPAEKENVQNTLRYFAAQVQSDGTFAFSNLPPGQYLILAQTNSELNKGDDIEVIAQNRRAAEAANRIVEFKPCQNVVDYQLPLTPVSVKQ